MPKTCPQCQAEAADAATFCPSCGAGLAAATAASAPTPPPSGPPPSGAAPSTSSTLPPYRFEATRWSMADRIAGIATIVLFISLFLPWYTASASVTVAGVHVGGSSSVNGLWHAWMYLALIISILLVAYLILRAGWDKLPVSQEVPHLTVMMVATIVNFVLALITFIDKPSGGSFGSIGINVGWGAGAILGLIASAVAAAPYVIPQLRAKTM